MVLRGQSQSTEATHTLWGLVTHVCFIYRCFPQRRDIATTASSSSPTSSSLPLLPLFLLSYPSLLLFSPFLFVWNKVIKQCTTVGNADSSTQHWHQAASPLASRGDAFYSTPARRSQMLPRTLQPSQPVMALPCGAELGCKAAC